MDKVWFITGCSRGLGLAIAEVALDSGASVVATARNPKQLQPLVDKYGSKVLALALDVTDAASAAQAVQTGHSHFGRLDIIVNNAGYANTASFEDMELSDFKTQLDTNFLGVVYVCKAVVPILRAQGSGHIFQISSLGGRLGTPGLSPYQSAKWAVGGFSTVLAQEVGPLGVKVTVLEPGGIKTDWAGSSMQIPEVSEPYKATVGATAKMLREMSGTEPSIPEKIAGIILKLVETKEPPLRLLVGPDAVQYSQYVADALKASDEKYRDLSLSSA